MHLICLRSAFLTVAATALLALPHVAQSATGTLAIASATYTVNQTWGVVLIYVKRTATADPKTGYADAASVGFATANISAISGVDYTPKSGRLTWGKGDVTAKTIVIPISKAKLFAGTKAFALAIASPSSGSSISTGSAIVTIDGAIKSSTSSGTKTATLSWAKPMTNTNGQSLTNLAGYKILYGTSASSLGNVIEITDPSTVTYRISNLKSGTWYFSILAYNTAGIDSPPAPTVSKTL